MARRAGGTEKDAGGKREREKGDSRGLRANPLTMKATRSIGSQERGRRSLADDGGTPVGYGRETEGGCGGSLEAGE